MENEKMVQLLKLVAEIGDKAYSGENKALEAYAKLYELKGIVEEAIDKIKPIAVSERSKYAPKELVVAYGITERYEVDHRGGRKTYKYDHDHTWYGAKKRLEIIEDAMKTAAEKEVEEIIDPSTGEVLSAAKINYGSDMIIMKKLKGGS